MKEYPVEFHKLSDKVECIWCGSRSAVKTAFKEKLFKLSKQYMLVIKSLEKDISECYIEEIVDLI